MKTLSVLTVACWSVSVTTFGAEQAEGGKHPHVVIVVGTLHYSPQNSMPVFAKQLERFGFNTTVVLPQGDPERNKNGVGLPGLEVLKSADLAIFFMRFLTLPDDQLEHILDYIASGKPVVGFRTSTHAFIYPKEHQHFRWNNGFGRDVLGTGYVVHQSGETDCEIVAKHQGHPVLTGVSEGSFRSGGTLYLTNLQPGCIPLVTGTGHRQGDRLIENQFGTYYIRETETDIVAWTWKNQWGGRVFCSSFGHVGDFSVQPIMRLLINGVCWAADRPIPSSETPIDTFQVKIAEQKRKAKKKN